MNSQIGPGARISKLLKKFNIRPHQGCSCYRLAREMDQVGSKVVLDNLDGYVDRMYESIREWRKSQNGFTVIITQPPKLTIRKLITWACSPPLPA